jgi:hypothetical protein
MDYNYQLMRLERLKNKNNYFDTANVPRINASL